MSAVDYEGNYVPSPGEEDYYGWQPDEKEYVKFGGEAPVIYSEQMENLPYDYNKSVALYRHLAKALKQKRLRARNQLQVGSCVGCAKATTIDHLRACDIAIRKQPEQHPKVKGRVVRTSAEFAYGAGRQIAGQLGRWDGSIGAWSARAVRDMGTISMMKHGSIDLTTYSEERCRRYALRGVPKSLLAKAKKHRCLSIVPVKTLKQAVSLIQNGYPLHICSSFGTRDQRDSDGFVRWNASWAHSMMWSSWIAIKQRNGRWKRGMGTENSWGDRHMGGGLPSDFRDLPYGGFVMYQDTVERIIHSGEVYAIGGYIGYVADPAQWDAFGGF